VVDEVRVRIGRQAVAERGWRMDTRH
jgi:hypothetical protein